jgi:hypothetical protein
MGSRREEVVEVFAIIAAFLAGVFASPPPLGVCTRPAAHVITGSQDTTIAVPVRAGLNPPQCE